MEGIDPGGHSPVLYLAEMRPPDLCHICEMCLRKAPVLTNLRDSSSETNGE